MPLSHSTVVGAGVDAWGGGYTESARSGREGYVDE